MTILHVLKTATRQISANYFLLPVAGKDRPIKRERVYCYELYHQLRIALNGNDLTLTAEPDKRGNPDFLDGKQPNPDFIFHTPGRHEDNTAVVEVECRLDKKHLIKDLMNLKLMKEKDFRVLVLLLFAASKVPWQRLKIATSEAEIDFVESSLCSYIKRLVGRQRMSKHPYDWDETLSGSNGVNYSRV